MLIPETYDLNLTLLHICKVIRKTTIADHQLIVIFLLSLHRDFPSWPEDLDIFGGACIDTNSEAWWLFVLPGNSNTPSRWQ